MEISQEEHLKRQRRSGLTIKEYADRAGIPVSRFYNWLKKARQHKAGGSNGSFVRLTPEPAATVEVQLQNGIVIKAPTTMDADALRRMVEAVSACAK